MSNNIWLKLGITVLCWEVAAGVNACNSSDFSLKGDYILGALFGVHGSSVNINTRNRLPEPFKCAILPFLPSGYQQLQVFRFAVQEINNSSHLLPGVTLGYEIFDYCTDALNFRAPLNFLSLNGSVSVPGSFHKVISVIGPPTSSKTLSVAPLFMHAVVPMVNPGATSVRLSNKQLYPSFFRTVPSDQFQVQALVQILQYFDWNWVAFIGSADYYSQDALGVFQELIRMANICVAFQAILTADTEKYSEIFDKLTILNINVVIVFANPQFVFPFMKKAINKTVKKVWIASDAWSLNRELLNEKGVESLGVVIGTSIIGKGYLSGLNDFIVNTMYQQRNASCINATQANQTCNQVCTECSRINPNVIVNQDPSINVPIYLAVYAVASALHSVLQCGSSSCKNLGPVEPYILTDAVSKVNFTLFGETLVFDENGNPPVWYTIVYWDWNSSDFLHVGFYYTDSEAHFNLNDELINWDGNKSAPVFRCSPECDTGYRRVQASLYSCCFDCEICIAGTYINSSVDPYTCVPCKEDEWSQNGSTSCTKCTFEYLNRTEPTSIAIVFGSLFMIASSVAIFLLFAFNFNTPVVKSAGGKMCFFLLTCLALSALCVLFFIGQPKQVNCMMRNPAFAICYTACLSCLAVRSFQIVCVFKMATKLPKAYEIWVKHNGQWFIIMLSIAIQFFLCVLWVGINGPQPVQRKMGAQIILDCTLGNTGIFCLTIIFLGLLSVACFSFAYMGTDLPENYNEGKSITFSLLIFYISWAVFLTVRLSADEKTTTTVNAITVLCSLYGVLFGYFFPKSYIVIFKPEQNTTAYFQTSIQSYTLQTSST